MFLGSEAPVRSSVQPGEPAHSRNGVSGQDCARRSAVTAPRRRNPERATSKALTLSVERMSPEYGRRGAGRRAAEGSTIRVVVGAVRPTLEPPIRADAISAIWPGSNYRPAAGPLSHIASRLSRLRSHWTTLTSSSSTARTEIPRLAIQLASRTMFHAAPTAGGRRVSLLLPPSLGQACKELIVTVRSAVDYPRPGVVCQHRSGL